MIIDLPVVTTTLMDFEKGEVGSQAYVPESDVCARVMMSEVTMSWVRRLITMVPTRLWSWVMICSECQVEWVRSSDKRLN